MNTVKKFRKRKENFICENCGTKVVGDGFTNHCPKCFYSKHVDIFPGDRLEDCGGLMEPVDIFTKSGKWVIKHRCLKCGYESQVKVKDNDDFDALVKLAEKIAKKKFKELEF